MRSNRTTRALSATALGLTLAFGAAACGNDTGGDTSAEVSATEHNDADVAFASEMLQHHAQALTMVDLTEGRDLDPEVQQLADEIRAAQAPEIETFTGWLTDWDEEVPDTGDAMEGMEEGEMDMPGMMSAADMTALEQAPDSEFQTMWLEMMIEHHTGAIDMAEAETEQGQYKPAIDLAEQIAESQAGEIETMENLLAS